MSIFFSSLFHTETSKRTGSTKIKIFWMNSSGTVIWNSWFQQAHWIVDYLSSKYFKWLLKAGLMPLVVVSDCSLKVQLTSNSIWIFARNIKYIAIGIVTYVWFVNKRKNGGTPLKSLRYVLTASPILTLCCLVIK